MASRQRWRAEQWEPQQQQQKQTCGDSGRLSTAAKLLVVVAGVGGVGGGCFSGKRPKEKGSWGSGWLSRVCQLGMLEEE